MRAMYVLGGENLFSGKVFSYGTAPAVCRGNLSAGEVFCSEAVLGAPGEKTFFPKSFSRRSRFRALLAKVLFRGSFFCRDHFCACRGRNFFPANFFLPATLREPVGEIISRRRFFSPGRFRAVPERFFLRTSLFGQEPSPPRANKPFLRETFSADSRSGVGRGNSLPREVYSPEAVRGSVGEISPQQSFFPPRRLQRPSGEMSAGRRILGAPPGRAHLPPPEGA